MATKRSIAWIQVRAPSSSKKRRSCRIDTACLAGTDEPSVSPRTLSSSSNQTGTVVAPTAAAMQDSTRIAVLVPFRDMHPTQQRRAHLDEFVPYM
uniref:Uncharacterized protein n=1 Tax=Hyaloperonospora arabidopsidis (strain Emoy2) TaxID=559515 RepID=M4C716_HYAAE